MPRSRTRAWRRLLLLPLLVCIGASAESVQARMKRAETLLAAGEMTQARELFEELRVENPAHEGALFGIGCTAYAQAAQEQNPQASAASLQEAAQIFQQLAAGPDPALAAHAAYNHANCLARQAAAIPLPEQYGQAVAAFRSAVSAYEVLLDRKPEPRGVRQNLDHVRLRLKELLQHPPEAPGQEQQPQSPPPQPPPQIVSIFSFVHTQVDGARVEVLADGDEARYIPPGTAP